MLQRWSEEVQKHSKHREARTNQRTKNSRSGKIAIDEFGANTCTHFHPSQRFFCCCSPLLVLMTDRNSETGCDSGNCGSGKLCAKRKTARCRKPEPPEPCDSGNHVNGNYGRDDNVHVQKALRFPNVRFSVCRICAFQFPLTRFPVSRIRGFRTRVVPIPNLRSWSVSRICFVPPPESCCFPGCESAHSAQFQFPNPLLTLSPLFAKQLSVCICCCEFLPVAFEYAVLLHLHNFAVLYSCYAYFRPWFLNLGFSLSLGVAFPVISELTHVCRPSRPSSVKKSHALKLPSAQSRLDLTTAIAGHLISESVYYITSYEYIIYTFL